MLWYNICFLRDTVIVSYFSDFGSWVVLQEIITLRTTSMKLWNQKGFFYVKLPHLEYFSSGAFSNEA